MTITETNLNPAAAGLPTEAELLKLAAGLYGEEAPASAAATGTDWGQIAADVLHEYSDASATSSDADSPTLVSAAKAADTPAAMSAAITMKAM